MTPNRGAKLSPLFLVLAVISLALASYGYFELFRGYAGMPAWLAFLAIGGLDLAAVATGKHALTVAEDGDSSAPWNALLLALTGLGAFAQLAYSMLAGHPLAVGIVSAAFPVVTVTLFEGQLRRRFRLNGRATGRVAQPRATIDPVTWLFYPQLALRATKLAVLDRGLDQGDALIVAEALLSRERAAAAVTVPARRRMRRTYADILEAGAVSELDVADNQPTFSDNPPTSADVHPPRPDVGRRRPDIAPTFYDNQPTSADVGDNEDGELPRGTTSRAVRAAVGRHGMVFADVLADVRMVIPGVKEDTVRTTMGRFQRTADNAPAQV